MARRQIVRQIWRHVFAALDLATGQMFYRIRDRKRCVSLSLEPVPGVIDNTVRTVEDHDLSISVSHGDPISGQMRRAVAMVDEASYDQMMSYAHR